MATHKCITEKDLEEFKGKEKLTPEQEKKMNLLKEQIQGCVFCKRLFWKFWAEIH